MTEECKLCGGTGEVTVIPCGAPDEDADSFGCPCCITKERDEDEAKLNARIAELERQLVESRDFAISEAAKIRAKYEHQQTVLVDAANAVLDSDGSRGTYDIVELEKSRTRLNAALAAVKPAGQKGGE